MYEVHIYDVLYSQGLLIVSIYCSSHLTFTEEKTLISIYAVQINKQYNFNIQLKLSLVHLCYQANHSDN